MKKVLALLLVLCMIVPFAAACTDPVDPNKPIDTPKDNYSRDVVSITGNGGATGELTVTPNLTLVNDADYADYTDWATYKTVLGDFYTYYLAAKAETDVSARYAVMALAEAKFLEAGVMLPSRAQGGNYAISRVVPNTANNVLWGFDSDRYTNVLVTTELITAADRTALKALYAEKKGTGTYQAAAKEYLTGKGYTFKNSYKLTYSSDPQTWDILWTYRSADTEFIVNTIDSLLSYDCEGRLTYALANNVTVSEDGLTYTFTLRDGLKWVTQQGQEYADLTAQDFVDGLERVLTAGDDGVGYIAGGVIKNADAFMNKKAQFSEVGVKALDDKTVQYTLTAPCSYFLSMMAYNTFLPVHKDYVTQQGKNYGTSPETILYCGPYLISSYTTENSITFVKNASYWEADHMNMEKIEMIYVDGKDPLQTYNYAIAGTLDGAGLNATSKQKAAEDGNFDKYAYVSGTDATTFSAFYNINRQSWSTSGYEEMDSTQTEAQKAVTKAALNNKNFRLALLHSVDRQAYNAALVGEDAKLNGMQNMYTPGEFVALERDIKIEINGEWKTFKAGTYYGEIVQAQLTADGSKLKVWDPTGGSAGTGSSSGFDGYYDVTAAKEYLAAAIEELKAAGVTVTKDNPITLDMPCFAASTSYNASAQAFKKSVEDSLGELVVVNLVAASKSSAWYSVGYLASDASDCNYDIYDVSGWGPDYGDPSSYLDTFLPNGGSMIKMIGLN